MNIKKYSVPVALVITSLGFVFFLFKTKSLHGDLVEAQKNESTLSKEVQDYEELVHIDSILLKGDYDTALDSYNKSLKFQNENKLGIPVRIALAEKLLKVAKEGEQFENNLKEDSLNKAKPATPNEIRKLDSLNFSLEKTKVQLANLKRQLKTKSFGEYLQFKSKKGNQMHYVGQVKNGQANGTGIALLDTGSRYEGEWKNNERHGEGSFYWPDGEKYVGAYEKDKRSGFGIYFWPNGEKYEGQWKEDKRNGAGKFFGTDGSIVTGGEWQDDKLVEADKKK